MRIPLSKILQQGEGFLRETFSSDSIRSLLVDYQRFLDGLNLQSDNHELQKFYTTVQQALDFTIVSSSHPPSHDERGIKLPASVLSAIDSGWFVLSSRSLLSSLIVDQLKYLQTLFQGAQHLSFASSDQFQKCLSHYDQTISDKISSLLKSHEVERLHRACQPLLDFLHTQKTMFVVNETQYQRWVHMTLTGETCDVLDQIESTLYYILPLHDTESLDFVEKTLIYLQASQEAVTSSRALRLLNCIYDGHLWQLENEFSTNVQTAEESSIVQLSLCTNSKVDQSDVPLEERLKPVMGRVSMIRLFTNTPSKRSDSSTKTLSDLARPPKAGTIVYRPEIQTPQVFVVVNGTKTKIDVTSRQWADSLPTVPHTTGELQILLEYEVAQDSLAGFHDFRWIFPDFSSVTVGLFDFSCLTNANLAPHGNAANEWSICTPCPIQGRVIVQPFSLKTTVCSSEFPGSWETLSTALNEDPIIQTVIETASGKKDPKPASSFSQPFSSFSTPDFMEPTQPSVADTNDVIIHISNALPGVEGPTLCVPTDRSTVSDPTNIDKLTNASIVSSKPSLLVDFFPHVSASRSHRKYQPLILSQMSGRVPIWSVSNQIFAHQPTSLSQKNPVAPNYVGSFVGTYAGGGLAHNVFSTPHDPTAGNAVNASQNSRWIVPPTQTYQEYQPSASLNPFSDVHLSDMSVWHAPIIQARMHSTFRGPYPFILHDDFVNEYGVLNYRLKEAWDLPMTEITTLSSKHHIKGILVKSPLLWGASFQADLAELLQKDSDGVAHYTADAIVTGSVCVSGNSPLPPVPIQPAQSTNSQFAIPSQNVTMEQLIADTVTPVKHQPVLARPSLIKSTKLDTTLKMKNFTPTRTLASDDTLGFWHQLLTLAVCATKDGEEAEVFPHPLFVKIVKKMWTIDPNFLFFADLTNQDDSLKASTLSEASTNEAKHAAATAARVEVLTSVSGLVPVTQRLSKVVELVFGVQKLNEAGRVDEETTRMRQNASALQPVQLDQQPFYAPFSGAPQPSTQPSSFSAYPGTTPQAAHPSFYPGTTPMGTSHQRLSAPVQPLTGQSYTGTGMLSQPLPAQQQAIDMLGATPFGYSSNALLDQTGTTPYTRTGLSQFGQLSVQPSTVSRSVQPHSHLSTFSTPPAPTGESPQSLVSGHPSAVSPLTQPPQIAYTQAPSFSDPNAFSNPTFSAPTFEGSTSRDLHSDIIAGSSYKPDSHFERARPQPQPSQLRPAVAAVRKPQYNIMSLNSRVSYDSTLRPQQSPYVETSRKQQQFAEKQTTQSLLTQLKTYLEEIQRMTVNRKLLIAHTLDMNDFEQFFNDSGYQNNMDQTNNAIESTLTLLSFLSPGLFFTKVKPKHNQTESGQSIIHMHKLLQQLSTCFNYRQAHPILQNGTITFLTPKHKLGDHSEILTFARHGHTVNVEGKRSKNKELLVILSNMIKYQALTYIDFEPLRTLITTSRVTDGENDETDGSAIVELKDITAPMKLTQGAAEFPLYILLSDLFSEPIYFNLETHSTKIYELSLHKHSFALEILAMQSAVGRLREVVINNLQNDVPRFEMNQIVRTLRRSLSNVNLFAATLFAISTKLCLIFSAEAKKQLFIQTNNDAIRGEGGTLYEKKAVEGYGPIDTPFIGETEGENIVLPSSFVSPTQNQIERLFQNSVQIIKDDSASHYKYSSAIQNILQHTTLPPLTMPTHKQPNEIADDGKESPDDAILSESTVVAINKWSIERTSAFLQSILYLMAKQNPKEERTITRRILALLNTLQNGKVSEKLHLGPKQTPVTAPTTSTTFDVEKMHELDSARAFVRSMAAEINRFNQVGPVVFVAPELGKWTTVGGLGVMVDELTQELAVNGVDVSVISPYYNVDRKGNTNYLAADGFEYLYNVRTSIGYDPVDCGVHYKKIQGVKLYFLHNYVHFPATYADQSPADRVRTVVLMAKGALELICKFEVLPSLIVSNDWFAGLCAAYGHHSGAFGSAFNRTTFFHIAHNLEEDYQGKVWANSNLANIHHLDPNILIDPYGAPNVLNFSRAAFLCSNQWGTVSPTYRSDLLNSSSLSPILRSFAQPFGTSNGVRKQERRDILLKRVGSSDHMTAKKRLQEKYFPAAIDEHIPVFGFVGRLTEQKGVLLMLHAAWQIIPALNGKIQMIIGGKTTPGDPYGDACQHQIFELRKAFPNSFWADPNEFFTDGPVLNIGCDYGLMPSLFEPGGIVQMEFFVAGTPVVAFKTGGLKDTVFETGSEETSNGFTFEAYTIDDYMASVLRAVALYSDKRKYDKMREVAFSSVIDVRDCAFNWYSEYATLRHRLVSFVDLVAKDEDAIASDEIQVVPKELL